MHASNEEDLMSPDAFKSLETTEAGERIATMTKLPDDPLTWVLQNPHAQEVLEELSDGKEHSPLEVRKTSGIHPESFRQTLHVLGIYALVRTHAPKGARWVVTPRAQGRRIQVVAQITPRGAHMVRFLEKFRALVRTHAADLPRATAERWLEA
jgi:hypothetical protein